MMHNFRPVSDIEYNVVLDTGKKIIITFTLDNDVYPEEEFYFLYKVNNSRRKN